MTVTEAQPTELAKLANSGQTIELIDVRMPAEYVGVHAKGAKNFPLNNLDPKAIMAARNGSADEPLYVICQMGGRSRKACEQFIAEGFSNVVSVAGGTALWESQGFPVVRGEKRIMAMDRQVRIAAGSMILLGVVLALTIQPAAAGLCLAGFVSADLVFSGVTNTCGMAAVLATMPWNRVKSAGEC